jgi:hypothetical protein
MTNVEIIKDFYTSDNYRNIDYVERLLDDSFSIEWNSSIGLFVYDKADILKLTKEMFVNYAETKIQILAAFGDKDQVAVHYNYFASTIENSSEMILIAKIMAIWTFKNGRIIHGYQTSVLG